VQKRLLKKLPLLRAEMEPPWPYGAARPETVVVGWGSTYGVLKEAIDVLSDRTSIALLHFSEIYPFPSTDKFDYLDLLKGASRSICVENNATSQFAQLMKAETGHRFTDTINKYDGRPFLLEEVVGALNDKLE
jgi:2-oxoglutarate ferredoxin oxidoreductase subunit alpha